MMWGAEALVNNMQGGTRRIGQQWAPEIGRRDTDRTENPNAT